MISHVFLVSALLVANVRAVPFRPPIHKVQGDDQFVPDWSDVRHRIDAFSSFGMPMEPSLVPAENEPYHETDNVLGRHQPHFFWDMFNGLSDVQSSQAEVTDDMVIHGKPWALFPKKSAAESLGPFPLPPNHGLGSAKSVAAPVNFAPSLIPDENRPYHQDEQKAVALGPLPIGYNSVIDGQDPKPDTTFPNIEDKAILFASDLSAGDKMEPKPDTTFPEIDVSKSRLGLLRIRKTQDDEKFVPDWSAGVARFLNGHLTASQRRTPDVGLLKLKDNDDVPRYFDEMDVKPPHKAVALGPFPIAPENFPPFQKDDDVPRSSAEDVKPPHKAVALGPFPIAPENFPPFQKDHDEVPESSAENVKPPHKAVALGPFPIAPENFPPFQDILTLKFTPGRHNADVGPLKLRDDDDVPRYFDD